MDDPYPCDGAVVILISAGFETGAETIGEMGGTGSFERSNSSISIGALSVYSPVSRARARSDAE